MEKLRDNGEFRRFGIRHGYGRPNAKVLQFMPDIERLEVWALPDDMNVDGLNRLRRLDSLSISSLDINDTLQLKKLKHVRHVGYDGADSLGVRLGEILPHIKFEPNGLKKLK